MKKILLPLTLLGFGAVFARAEEPQSSYSISLDLPYVSKYTFRGQQLGKDAVQPSVEVGVADFYAGVWTNQPFKSNEDDEFDFYGGYKAKLNDSWSLDLGGTLYYYPDLDTSLGGERSTIEAFAGINGDIKGVTPGLYIYHDFDLENTTVQGQVGYSIPLPEAGLSLDLTASAGHVFADTTEDYNYLGGGANLSYKWSPKSTIYAGVAYTTSDADSVKKDIVSFTAGVSLAF